MIDDALSIAGAFLAKPLIFDRVASQALAARPANRIFDGDSDGAVRTVRDRLGEYRQFAAPGLTVVSQTTFSDEASQTIPLIDLEAASHWLSPRSTEKPCPAQHRDQTAGALLSLPAWLRQPAAHGAPTSAVDRQNRIAEPMLHGGMDTNSIRPNGRGVVGFADAIMGTMPPND